MVNTQYGPTTRASSQIPSVGTSANQGSSVTRVIGRAGSPQPEIHTSDASSEPSLKKIKTDVKVTRDLEAEGRAADCLRAPGVDQGTRVERILSTPTNDPIQSVHAN